MKFIKFKKFIILATITLQISVFINICNVTAPFQAVASVSEQNIEYKIVSKQTNQDQELINELQEVIKKTKKGILLLKSLQNGYLFTLDSLPELIIIDIADNNLVQVFDKNNQISKIPEANLFAIAKQMVGYGLKERTDGNYNKAYYSYRFALLVATYYQDIKGIDIISNNIWYLLLQLYFEKRGTSVPLASHQNELASQKKAAQELAAIEKVVMADSKALLGKIKQMKNQEMTLLLVAHRLAALGGDSKERISILNQLVSSANSTEQCQILLKAVIDEFAQITIVELVAAKEITTKQNAEIEQFKKTWGLYVKHRAILDKVEPSQFVNRLNFALLNFQYMRSTAVSGGGSFGHRVSYIVSEFLQPVGRDLVFLLGKAGSHSLAMNIAEDIRSRALLDWMGRTHTNTRLSVNPSIPGSGGEIYSASSEEILATTKKLNAPLLMYTKDQYGYSVWLLGENGQLYTSRLENINQTVNTILQKLPYAKSKEDINALQSAKRSLFTVDSKPELKKNNLDTELNQLYKLLFPQEIQEGLSKLKAKRIAILTDNVLDFIPFSALRTNDGQYLVEKYEIFYLPSVTAQLLIQDDENIFQSNVGKAVLIGNPKFSNPYTVNIDGRDIQLNFSPLPGTEREVKAISQLLKTTPVLGKDANMKNIVTLLAPIDVIEKQTLAKYPLLHIASHGILLSDNPEESFIALSEGKISANYLYEFDPGLRVKMVILSACQTALGISHPDSAVGLSNAFLVAGANTVGSTLWQISDDATVDLMVKFYEELLKGINVSSALRNAQISMIKNSKWKHPKNWAAFKIIGSTNNPLKP